MILSPKQIRYACERAGMVLALFFCACSSAQKATGPLYDFRADIQIQANGKSFEGMGVADQAPVDLKIRSKARLDLLMISSCHRTFSVEKVDPNWFGGASKDFSYRYEPTEIEKEGFCPLFIQAFDQKGPAAWAYVAIKTKETLPAMLDCNGSRLSLRGVYACQTQAGLIEGISFERPVKYAVSENCDFEKKSETLFSIRVKKGFCYATFSDGENLGRLVLLGFERVLVRGE